MGRGRPFIALVAIVLIAIFAACDASSVQVPETSAARFAINSAKPLATYGCYADVDPSYNPVQPNFTYLAPSCSLEVCQAAEEAEGLRMKADSVGFVDVAVFRCANGDTVSIGSNGKLGGVGADRGQCWDCMGQDPLSACNGQMCFDSIGVYGWDVGYMSCPEGYDAILDPVTSIPENCRKPCPPPPPAGPSTTASTFQGMPRITWSAVTGAVEYNVYWRTDVMSGWELDMTIIGTTYTDPGTEVSGSPLSSAPSGAWVSYRVTYMTADDVESQPGPTHYYHYLGGGGPS